MNENKFKIIAEHEENESILVTWPAVKYVWRDYNQEEVYLNVVRELQEVVHVYIQCLGLNVDEIKNTLTENDIPLDNIEFVQFESDIINLKENDPDCDPMGSLSWPRDYGAEIVRNEKGERAVVAFDQALWGLCGATKYEREAAVNESFCRWQAKLAGIDNVIYTRLVSEGGDRDYNGAGVLLTTKETEVDKRNPQYTVEEVEAEFKRVLGIEKVLWVPRGTYDEEEMNIGRVPGPDNKYTAYRLGGANCHMDEMARFADEKTIILGEISEEDANKLEIDRLNKERYDEAYEYLKTQTDVNGEPYKIVRIPVPETMYFKADFRKEECLLGGYAERVLQGIAKDEKGEVTWVAALSYCNFIVTNGKVIAQQYYSEGLPEIIKKKDEEALRVLRECFPGRKVIGVNTYALNILGGGIHCFSKQMPPAFPK